MGDVKPLARTLYRAALWVAVLAIVGSSLFTFSGLAAAASPNYSLTGFVYQPTALGGAVPAGVQVDLVSQATGAVYTTTTGSGGQFTFTASGTSSALAPGWWGLWVPPQTNLTLGGCNPCAILSQQQNPVYQYLNATELTTYSPWVVSNVNTLPYNSTLTGNVSSQGIPEPGATVRLLAPSYAGVVLVTNITNINGTYVLKVPFGNWTLQTTFTQGPTLVNTTPVAISSRTPPKVNPSLQSYLVTGKAYLAATPTKPVPNGGNATLYDAATANLYTTTTPAGGYYALGTYPGSFDVVLSTVGYGTTSFPLTVTAPSKVIRDVYLRPVTSAQVGNFTTNLNFTELNVTNGTGTLLVRTLAALGNNSVFAYLPNVTIGQLWSQLGLDYNHSLNFPAADLAEVEQFVNSSGPFFPAIQANTLVNATGFIAENSSLAPKVVGFRSTCTTTCGIGSAATINYGWYQNFTLNGTVAKNSSTYSISFGFQHPVSGDTYNYTVELPAGYVLAADTQAPTRTQLVANGPGGTWTKFTLVSLSSANTAGSAKFTIVKAGNLTANINVTSTNFAFSTLNVLNVTHGNYSVVVGVGQNITFSALNSTYPAGTNGTAFAWTFGDGSGTNTTKPTTYHTYTATSGATFFNGTVTITSSGQITNFTWFHVFVVSSAPIAGVTSNATGNQLRTVNGTPYLFVNWSTVLHFNATTSVIATPNLLAISTFSVVGSGFKLPVANYTSSSGGHYWQNYTLQFLGNGRYLTTGLINGNKVPFLGWQYNLTLTVWTATGKSAKTGIVILVNDTQPPSPAFTLLNSAGKVISGSGVIEGTNGTAKVSLNAANTTDPNNGSVVRYYWLITNSGNTSIHLGNNTTTVRPYPYYFLYPMNTKYTVNLTVWDRNGNHAYTTQTLSVSVNSTTRPIMAAENLTAPTTFTAGTSYTFWTNITVGGGSKAIAYNVTVSWYLLSASGTGSKSYIGGSPGSVVFYNYTSPGVLNNASFATGIIPSLPYNKTVRAQLTWTPSTTGNFILYANATAVNEYGPDNAAGTGTVSQSISVKPNPTTELLEVLAVVAAVVVVIVLLIWWYRRPARRGGGKGGRSSGTDRSSSRRPSADDDDEDE